MAGKYIVRCDIEGVSGVVSYEQAEPGKPEFAFGHRRFMADLTALIDGLTEGGAELVVVFDEHYYGRNVLLDQMPDNVQVISGKPPYRPDWPGGLDRSFKGLVLLGYHSKRGTPHGLLNHTFEPDIRDIRLNGVSIGEIGIEIAVAGDFSVPLVLMTGDSAAVAEARELAPEAVCVTVKESLGETGGLCYPVVKTSRMIRKAAHSVAGEEREITPYCAGDNVCLEILLNPGPFRDQFNRLFARAMADESTVRIQNSNTTTAYSRYWQMKNDCFDSMSG